nr:MAG TPA: hypothetical protein [Bacteriophage sp.]
MINFENKRVLFIDLDSTLIKTISGKTFPEDITDFRIQLPVLDKIVEKLPNLEKFFIVTNQGGIGKFITKEDFDTKIISIFVFCGNYLRDRYYPRIIIDNWEYCDSMDKADPMRKPNTGMLEQLYACEKNKEECIMIGDASGKPGDFSDSDKKCAENFGIDYIDVRDFLNL